MSEVTYSTPEPHPEDYEVTPDTPMIRFRVRCKCGNERRNVRAIVAGVEFLRQALATAGVTVPPDLPVLSFWCNRCKTGARVTAKTLGIAV